MRAFGAAKEVSSNHPSGWTAGPAKIGRRGPYRPTRFAGTPTPHRPGITPALKLRTDGDDVFIIPPAARTESEDVTFERAKNRRKRRQRRRASDVRSSFPSFPSVRNRFQRPNCQESIMTAIVLGTVLPWLLL